MVAREHKQTKKSTGVVVSLTIHALLLLLLFLILTEKKLSPLFLPAQPSKQPERSRSTTPAQPQATKKSDDPTKKATLDQPFVVPAPVVFYGNQAMMNKPVPVSGHADGKSAFEHTPTSLPTPPAHAIAPERTVPVVSETIGDKVEVGPQEEHHEQVPATPTFEKQPEQEAVAEKQESFSEPTPSSLVALATQAQESTVPAISKKQSTTPKKQKAEQANKLTLADLFKNSRNTIASFAQDGLPSAKKAGTEGGDDLGSGHQITIKEGDMRYYTLWSTFLNHLNASARFSRRGKEHLIQEWVRTHQIQYILHCGITIDLEGNVIDVDLVVSSGCKEFDNLCLNDIYTAAPFPPLSERLGKKTARFEVSVYP